jgi:hypothetical protein
MKYIKNVKNLLVAVLLLIVVFYQVKDCSNKPEEGGVTHEIDTVYKEVKVEVPKYVPKWRTKVETVEIPVQVSGDPIPIDTAEILKDYYTRYHIIDTLVMHNPDSGSHSLGYAVVTDIIGKNAIVERSVVWKYQIPIVTHTITVHPKPKAQVYIGATANVNSVQILSSVSGALLYKTKKDRIYLVNVGVADNGQGVQPFLGGGIFWKIQLKKPKVTDLIIK